MSNPLNICFFSKNLERWVFVLFIYNIYESTSFNPINAFAFGRNKKSINYDKKAYIDHEYGSIYSMAKFKYIIWGYKLNQKSWPSPEIKVGLIVTHITNRTKLITLIHSPKATAAIYMYEDANPFDYPIGLETKSKVVNLERHARLLCVVAKWIDVWRCRIVDCA